MEKNDLAMMKAENDRLAADVEKLKQRLREEITRTQAGVRLDLNLEKGALPSLLTFHDDFGMVKTDGGFLGCRPDAGELVGAGVED